MTRITTSEARHDFAEMLNRVAYTGERVVLHRRGKDVAAIVSVADLHLLQELEDKADLKAANAALKEAAKKGTKPLAQVVDELDG